MTTPDHCLNCGGTEPIRAPYGPKGSTDTRLVCRDCDWPWGEPPTRECESCDGGRILFPSIHQRCSSCNGTGRIDVSHLPLCSICRRRHGGEVTHERE